MKNKKLLFSLGALVFAIGCFGSSFTSATSFSLDIKKFQTATTQVSNIVPIHFADNGNDFGGFMYLSDGIMIVDSDEDGDQEIEIGDTTDTYCIYSNGEEEKANCEGAEYVCGRQVRGFYYNAERGERLWPLDDETSNTWNNIQWTEDQLETEKLETTGGLYTICRQNKIIKDGVELEYLKELKKCEKIKAPECPDDNPDCDDSVQDSESCVENVYENFPMNDGYFGQIKHVYKGQTFGLVVGSAYRKSDDSPFYDVSIGGNGVELGETFIRHRGIFPLGFVYDYNGGLGFAGCQIIQDSNKSGVLDKLLQKRPERNSLFIPNGKGGLRVSNDLKGIVDCENIGRATESLLKLIIEGLIGMNKESKLGYIGTQEDTKMQYFSSSDINNATLLNYVKQRSEILCRGKWNKEDANIVCIDEKTNGDTVNADDDKYKGKTLIVKGKNVIVNPGTNADSELYYDMFINGGNLIINEGAEPKFVFTKQGFIAKDSNNVPISGNDFKLMLDKFPGGGYVGKDIEGNTIDWVGVGSFIRGNFVVDGNVVGPDGNKLKDKYFIYGKFTTRDSFNQLENTFAWRCKNGLVIDKSGIVQDGENGRRNQGKYCPPSVTKKENGETVYEWYNPYEGAALVVIDQNYDSPLYW